VGVSSSGRDVRNLGQKSPYGRDSAAFSEKLKPDTALMGLFSLSHNVPALLEAPETSLTDLASLYLAINVGGQF
jgi:hypothetical protein